MIKPELKPVEPIVPGYARLVLKAWKGAANNVLISVLRNQDSLYLDSTGQWVSGEVFLTLPTLEQMEDTPSVQIGPQIIDALLANRQAAYRITIKDDATRDVGVLMMPPGLLSSQAGGENLLLDHTRTLEEIAPVSESPAPLPPVETPEPEPQPEPEPEPPVTDPAPAPAKSRLWLWLAIAAAIVVLLGAAAWWFLRTPETPVTAAPTPVPAPAQTSGPCGDDLMSKGSELEFVKGCLHSQPGSEQLLQVIDKAKASKRCDIAQRLYAYKAQSGDLNLAMRYAQEYDPKTAQANGCFSPDAQTAIYWYEVIVNQDPQRSEAKARLAELKK